MADKSSKVEFLFSKETFLTSWKRTHPRGTKDYLLSIYLIFGLLRVTFVVPMTILFIGSIFAIIFSEIEALLNKESAISLKGVLQFHTLRNSWVMVFFLLFTASLAAAEIYWVIKGDLYQSGIPKIGFFQTSLAMAALPISCLVKIKQAGSSTESKKLRLVAGFLSVIFVGSYFF